MQTTMTPEQTQETVEQKLKQKMTKYFQNLDIANERKLENEILKDEIAELYEQAGKSVQSIDLPEGGFGVASNRVSIREVLDRDGLSEELGISKDELKTPFDFSMLTKQEKITPDVITKHTRTETKVSLSLRKMKKKPKEKKTT